MQNLEFYKGKDDDTIAITPKPVPNDLDELLRLFLVNTKCVEDTNAESANSKFNCITYHCLPRLYELAQTKYMAEMFYNHQVLTQFK